MCFTISELLFVVDNSVLHFLPNQVVGTIFIGNEFRVLKVDRTSDKLKDRSSSQIRCELCDDLSTSLDSPDDSVFLCATSALSGFIMCVKFLGTTVWISKLSRCIIVACLHLCPTTCLHGISISQKPLPTYPFVPKLFIPQDSEIQNTVLHGCFEHPVSDATLFAGVPTYWKYSGRVRFDTTFQIHAAPSYR